jgi:signal transduction histidine kinase
MLSGDRVGPLTDAQRRVVDEAARSCARLSTLLSEASEVAHFHQGRLSYLRGPVSLSRIIASIELAPGSERRLVVGDGVDADIVGDATRLGRALSAVASSVARETMDSEELHVLPTLREAPGGREAFIAIGSEAIAREILDASPTDLSDFDATRGGNGLSLVIARQVLQEHQGRLYGAPGERARAGAAIALPLSS